MRILSLSVPLVAAALVATGAGPAAAGPTRDFSRSFADSCTVLHRSYAVPAVVSGTVPVSVPAGTAFRLTGLVFRARIPAELATTAYDLGARSAVLRISGIDARGVGVLPGAKNVLASPVTTRIPVRREQPLPFRAPVSGSVSAGFTAGPTPGTGRLQAGAVRATITLRRADGSVLARDEPVTCGVPSPAVTVTTVRIT